MVYYKYNEKLHKNAAKGAVLQEQEFKKNFLRALKLDDPDWITDDYLIYEDFFDYEASYLEEIEDALRECSRSFTESCVALFKTFEDIRADHDPTNPDKTIQRMEAWKKKIRLLASK